MNELVIGRDSHGYVALYCYVAAIDTVFVLAIRSQREAGHARGGGGECGKSERALLINCFIAAWRSLHCCV